MMDGPSKFVDWINENIGFNPRAGKYSDTLAGIVLDSLKSCSVEIRGRIKAATLRTEINADVATESATRNVDMVIWGGGGDAPKPYIALENKLILAAHGKARKNRLGDIVAFSNHTHNANRFSVSAGLIGINLSAEYANPDPFATGMNRPRFNMDKVVSDTIGIYARIPQRNDPDEPHDRPEAFGVIVFKYDGKGGAELVTEPPAPPVGHVLHYDTFIQRISSLYEQRHAG